MITSEWLREMAKLRLDNMGVTGVGYKAEEMLEWKVADEIDRLNAEVERLRLALLAESEKEYAK